MFDQLLNHPEYKQYQYKNKYIEVDILLQSLQYSEPANSQAVDDIIDKLRAYNFQLAEKDK